jgi:RND family efflux transporter MFP subunit
METTQTEPTNREQASKPQVGLARTRLLLLLIVCLLLACVIAGGIWQRTRASVALARATERAAIASVDVVHPHYDGAGGELVLPGNAQAYLDTPVYARTSGYLRSWHFDIGARVRKGQLLAEIESPEIDKQLLQARANLATAQANLSLATITSNRDDRLLKTNAISTQERDNASAVAAADKAIVDSNRAEVARLEQLQSFERIGAPFDGVITARNTDVGALINAGSASSKELFHIGSTNLLRVYVAVPEAWSRIAHPGLQATLTLAEFPNQPFPCTLVRNAGSIDAAARTLLAEFDVENPSGQLLPGAYVQVHLKLPSGASPLMIPSNTLLFRSEGIRVGVVKDGRTQLVPIQIGRDYGSAVEVLSGLQPQDQVILDPSDSLIDGAPVRIHAVQGPK